MRATQAVAVGTTEQHEALESAAGSMSEHGEADGGTQPRHQGHSWWPEEVADLAIWGQKAILQQFAQENWNKHIYWAISAQMSK